MKADLINRILCKGYRMSVDDGRALLLHDSKDFKQISIAMAGISDLLWIYDRLGNKLGWLRANSRTGQVLDYSTRDTRLCDLVADEFLGTRRRK